ncbi:methionyl-tRNA formyltransferase [Winogradskyella sp.]|uniref:methionyl-tRNA formyltransferase n=1 Tax=Winogradskyella sp. TaxID=1883156 RepID=UPI003AB3EED7
MYNILVIGAVKTAAITIKKLVEHEFNIVGVLGLNPVKIDHVSGWADLKLVADEFDLEYLGFSKINNQEQIDWAMDKKPDIIFAVGFSQLLKDVWLKMPKLGCIGFHPTKLPEGRGRAPLAWVTLERKTGSATFFLMGEGADDGPIFVQSIFNVEENDDANTVEEKIGNHIIIALDNWLPELKKGIWNPRPQDHSLASWYGKRAPEDGLISWNNSAEYINRLIKASSRPHPGSYTYFKDSKVIIWESEIEKNIKIQGVIGRILLSEISKGFLVQCGSGLLWIKNIQVEDNIALKIGDKLGYNLEDEIYLIKKRFKNEK